MVTQRRFSAGALYLVLLGLGYAFLFGPMYLYFLVNESQRGGLVASEAVVALGISIAGDVAFAAICWFSVRILRRVNE